MNRLKKNLRTNFIDPVTYGGEEKKIRKVQICTLIFDRGVYQIPYIKI